MLVTGARGFVGGALVRVLSASGFEVVATTRGDSGTGPGENPGIKFVTIGDVTATTVWRETLEGIDAVVHLAARVHVMNESAADPLAKFRHVNVEGTRALAGVAVAAKVKQMVFLSSVKVNGEATDGRGFLEDDPPRPEDAYGISKWEAEQALNEIAAAGSMEIVILRAPLVYGPGVKGNFSTLLRLCDSGIPIPLGSIDDNARSFIYLGNLNDAIRQALTRPEAAGRTYLVRDGEDLATAELVQRLREAFGRPARLGSLPPALLRAVAAVLGKRESAARLLGSLVVDDARIRNELGWAPPFSVAQGLAATATCFRTECRRRGPLDLLMCLICGN